MHAIGSWFSATWTFGWASLALDVGCKATVLLSIAVLATVILRRSSAALRHRVWCLTFAGLVLLPVLSAALPEWRLEVLPYSSPLAPREVSPDEAWRNEPIDQLAPRLASADTNPTSRATLIADPPPFVTPGGPLAEREDYFTPTFAPDTPGEPFASELADGPRESRGPMSLVALWLLGAVAAASPLALGLLRNYLLRRSAQPVAEVAWTGLLDELRVRLGLRRRVSLYETRAALMPMTWGMLSPIVMLPHAARAWTERLRRFVLLHELAHVKRCDVGFQMLARLACALYWFHPLAWYALRRLRIERELACDDCVVQAGERPSDYAAELLAIARSYRPLRLAAAVPMAQTSNLERRIRSLFDRACSHLPISPRAARLLLLGTAAIVTTIAVVRLAPRAAAEADEPSNVAQVPSAGTGASADDDLIAVSGRVVDPNGKAFAGANVFAVRWYWEPHIPHPPLSETKSGPDGRFTISFRKSQFSIDVGRPDQWEETTIVATADTFGAGWVTWRDIPSRKDAILQLVHDVPIKGRVVDLEGRPIAGVAVKLGEIATAKNGNLDAYLAAIRRGEFSWTSFRALDDTLPQFDAWPPQIITDSDGRFLINGVGRERRVHLSFQGPTIAYQKAIAVTRPSETLLMKTIPGRDESETVYGAEFELAAPPTRPIEGVVRDADTGKPLGGVSIESDMFAGSNYAEQRHLRAVSDDAGHYRLIGMPKGKGNRLIAVPNDDQPYLMREVDVPDSRGLEPVEVDIELRRGVWITGRVTDNATGKPVIAVMHYLPFRANRYAQETPEFGSSFTADGFQRRYVSRLDGSYRLVGLPGRAIVGAECIVHPYRRGVGADAISGIDDAGHFDTYANPIQPGPKWPNAMKAIDPPPGADSVVCDFQLDPGETLTIDVVDGDGQPVRGCDFGGLKAGSSYEPEIDAPRVEVINLGPDENRTLVVRHTSRHLGKVFRVRLADYPSRSLSVSLEPSAKVIGRLFDRQGIAVSGAEVTAWAHPPEDFRKQLPATTTDEEGRFEYSDIPTGCLYDFYVASARVGRRSIAADVSREPGESKELGDVTVGGATQTTQKVTPPQPTDQGKLSAAQPNNAAAAITIRGRVLDAADKPLAGARVRVVHVDTEWITWIKKGRLLAETKSNSDGAFTIDVRNTASVATGEHFLQASTVVLADMPGKGFDWSSLQAGGEPLSLQLVDDAAIEGRILDLEGRPIAGVRVSVDEVSGGATDFGSWIEKAKSNPVSLDPDQMMRPIKSRNKNPGPSVARYPGNKNLQLGAPELMPSAVTGRDGKFRLVGLGRDRQVRLQLDGAGIAKTWLTVVTHDMPPVPYPGYDPRFRVQTCFGRRFDLTAEPEQPISGVIRDADTAEPLSGVEVRLTRYADSLLFVEGFLAATTDDQGRYVLRGVPKPNHPERAHCLRLMPAAGQPYFRTEANPPKQDGLGHVSFDVALKRAIRVHGQVSDATTGEPVRGLVAYYPFLSNKAAAGFSNFNSGLLSVGNDDWYATDQDGRYEIPVLPGRGIVMFAARQGERYAEAEGAEAIADLYQADRKRLNVFHLYGLEVASAVREIDAAQAETVLDIKLRRLEATEIEFLDPAGNPLVGVVTRRLVPVRLAAVGDLASEWSRDALPTAVAELIGAQDQSRTAMFVHRQKKLAAALRLSQKNIPPNRVVLRPCAAIVGRVVDHRGMPVSDIEVSVNAAAEPSAELEEGWKHATLDRRHQLAILVSDRDGNFHIDSVPPGVAYVLSDTNHRSQFQKTTPVIQPGEMLDLGNLVLEAPEAAHDETVDFQTKQE